MPAIQPARLKHQTAQLVDIFDAPDQFLKVLHTLLNLYADHTQRPGQGGEPTPLLESYRVPQPVLREIIFELRSCVRAQQTAAFILCQRLWDEPILECRWIASALLGQISELQSLQILQVVQKWLDIKPEDQIMQVLLDHGLCYLRKEHPEVLFASIKEWLSNSELYLNRCGIWALYFMAVDPSFDNFPEVFRLLTPFIRSSSAELRPDLINILHRLAHFAPQETAYVLRQNISISEPSDTAWFIRQLIHEFPRPIQESLRESLKPVQ